MTKGIAGLFAYTSHDNKGMISLFNTLPFKVKKSFEDDMVVLRCRFDEPQTDAEHTIKQKRINRKTRGRTKDHPRQALDSIE